MHKDQRIYYASKLNSHLNSNYKSDHAYQYKTNFMTKLRLNFTYFSVRSSSSFLLQIGKTGHI